MHSDAMSEAARGRKDLRSTFVEWMFVESSLAESRDRASQRSGRFVRLSQLRKLRECEQVAAVCYRVRRGSIEFLLVQTRGSGRWTFPKGSTEPGLSHAQAAALEAFEEAGVHGRIEEVSFARYVRRRGDNRRGAVARSVEKEFSVKAYLCEVLRLSAPKELNRNRTWFPVEDAQRSLREGRNTAEGSALARVLNLAVARIRQRGSATSSVGRTQEGRHEEIQMERQVIQKDPLQRVQVDFAGRNERIAEALPSLRLGSQSRFIRESAAGIAGISQHELLSCEVLEFDVQKRKTKALGTGGNHS